MVVPLKIEAIILAQPQCSKDTLKEADFRSNKHHGLAQRGPATTHVHTAAV